jgi:FRG domain
MAGPPEVAEGLAVERSAIRVRKCDWVGFQVEVEKIRRETPSDDAGILFRGQSRSVWPLSTTLERASQFDSTQTLQSYYERVDRLSTEVQSVTGKRWRFRKYCKESDPAFLRISNFEYLTYLRHHGFPSPLLDWTRSPYIAAFFAFCDADAHSGESVAVFALIDWKRRIDFFNAPRIWRTGAFVLTDERHYKQQSDYTIAYRNGYKKTEWSPLRDLLLPHEEVAKAAIGVPQHGTNIIKIEIPARERGAAMAYFAEHNINRHTLYGDEDSFIKSLADTEFLDF